MNNELGITSKTGKEYQMGRDLTNPLIVIECFCIVQRSFNPNSIMEIMKRDAKPNFDYPVRTQGSEHARELRERSNKLPDDERNRLAKNAMARVRKAKKGD